MEAVESQEFDFVRGSQWEARMISRVAGDLGLLKVDSKAKSRRDRPTLHRLESSLLFHSFYCKTICFLNFFCERLQAPARRQN